MRVVKKHIFLVFSIIVVAGTVAFIDLQQLYNYSAQTKPAYIVKDNTPLNNAITNSGATLGRVLFYDKALSANNTIACASCHKQEFAFGDTAALSKGHLGGLTGRHAMRLSNPRYGVEAKFFWDERATSLEDQTTHPLKDPVEMGWSGNGGQGNIDSLIKKMKGISYYKILFPFVFGDSAITESRIQFALAQFVRSIQSFDSKFDVGFAQTNNLAAPFPNFSAIENQGKALFLAPPPAGGAGCQGCHAAPEFDIDPNTLNNGVIAVAGSSTAVDLTNTRAPSLRNVFNSNGQLNGPLMHNANFTNMMAVINHYNSVPQIPANTNLDPRLQGPGGQLNLTQNQMDALVAFLRTLSGTAIYTDVKWSDPFDSAGNLTLLTGITENLGLPESTLFVYPSISSSLINIESTNHSIYSYAIYSSDGRLVSKGNFVQKCSLQIDELAKGIYFIEVIDDASLQTSIKRFVKQ